MAECVAFTAERELFDGIDKIEWKCKGVHGKMEITFLEKKGGCL